MAKRASSTGRLSQPREVAVAVPAPEPVQAPVPFSAIHGQDRAISILSDALRSGRIHHAWVFHGPAGVGKFTSALAFASLLLDPSTQETFGGTFEADSQSMTQHLLASGTHPDLHVITKELARFHEDSEVRKKKLTNIPLDVIRTFLLGPGALGASMRTQARAAKVFIVDEAELMGAGSQNAVLKFLEEPPSRSVVILVTPSEERLLPTIRSRCQRVFFPPLGDKDMERWLAGSGLEVASKDRHWIVAFAAGSPGMLAGAIRGGLPAWREQLGAMLEAAAEGRYSVALGPAMADLVDEWAKTWVEKRENASKEAANKAGADWMLRLIAASARGLMTSDRTRAAGVRWSDAIRSAESEIDANVNLLFVFEKLSSELAAGQP
ncbi:DNA polymerase III subunit gamma/tau [Phycisphaerales bacterium]|nr:DNA polymerase III subunit gamma/tau [Phycisphaerales bacterium]